MKFWRVVDVNGDKVSTLRTGEFDNEQEAEEYAERGQAGDHVVEIDTVKEAAEEMLAALKAMLNTHGIHGPCEQHNCRDCDSAYGTAREAIKKAEGRR